MSVTKKIAEGSYDAWDKESLDYHQRYATANTFAGGGNTFGLSDLNYYGSFINAGGFGSFWQPYFAGQGWSPYANGVWALYPGAGYSWVSPYPWGWLPYHSGAWGYCQGVGWGWQPGGAWNGLNNIAAVGLVGGLVGTAGRPVRSPLRPALPVAPAAGTARASLVLANQRPMVFSKEDKPGNFVFEKDSAGLGVPRGSLGSLHKISNDVGRHGSASMPVYADALAGSGHGPEHEMNRGPVTLRPASASALGGERGGYSLGARQGSYGQEASRGSAGSQGAPSFHGGGAGPSAPSSGGSAGGGAHGGASPK